VEEQGRRGVSVGGRGLNDDLHLLKAPTVPAT
jgi:hypothetical protein